MTIPVAKISLSFQLSGIGEGLTLSLDIVMIVPGNRFTSQARNMEEQQQKKKKKKRNMYNVLVLTIVKNSNDENHQGREVKSPEYRQQHKPKLLHERSFAN